MILNSCFGSCTSNNVICILSHICRHELQVIHFHYSYCFQLCHPPVVFWLRSFSVQCVWMCSLIQSALHVDTTSVRAAWTSAGTTVRSANVHCVKKHSVKGPTSRSTQHSERLCSSSRKSLVWVKLMFSVTSVMKESWKPWSPVCSVRPLTVNLTWSLIRESWA